MNSEGLCIFFNILEDDELINNARVMDSGQSFQESSVCLYLMVMPSVCMSSQSISNTIVNGKNLNNT
jgi:hypothetical protein